MTRVKIEGDRGLTSCAVTHKISFKSRRSARQRLHNWKGHGNVFRGQSVYRCPDCGNWHITSQPKAHPSPGAQL